MTETVMTVRGPVAASELGLVLIHEHLFVDTLREYRADGLVQDLELAVGELEAFRDAGGGTLVDVTPGNLGRRPDLLRLASERTDVHVVMGCGLYRDPYIAETGADRRSVDALARELIAEIDGGADGTPVRPGIIGEVGTDAAWVSALEERGIRAAARAQRASGLAVTLHAARWPVGRELVGLLTEEGVPADRIIVGHLDTVPDPAFHRELADLGCWVQFDGFATDSPYEVARQVGYVRELVEGGFGDRVLISHDLFRLSHYAVYGGVGLRFVPDTIRGELVGAGIAADDVERILTTNPQRALAGS